MAKTSSKTFAVALAGNPNSGKTTIFNNLTGARQRVGNYPGVTVEIKEGTLRRGDLHLKLLDLPGTYSLSAFSEEELVARDFLLNHAPDVVVNVVDASNLERNLYLTTELLETGLPMVVVLNMSDTVRDRGEVLDIALLAERLGAPVVPAVGHRGEGMDGLFEAITRVILLHDPDARSTGACAPLEPGQMALGGIDTSTGQARVDFGEETETVIDDLSRYLPPGDRRWRAIKLLENDKEVLKDLPTLEDRSAVEALVSEFARGRSDEADTFLARRRYEFIGRLCNGVAHGVRRSTTTFSDRLDRVVMHPVWGVPIFLAMMFVVFNLTFRLGNPLMDIIDLGFSSLAELVTGFWAPGSENPLKSLLVDGIIGGVGGVIVFLPNIVLLFLAIAVLEGTGYMARAAFVMDRFMNKVGLHGKSFIPLLIGFGCTVPAIMATRTLETRRDRLITMMVLPLMSCGARLPIYALLIPAFFALKWQGPVLWLIYVTGIVLALLGALLMRATLFRGENTPFMMELPPYRMPTPASLLIQMWTRAWLYLKKAGTVILGAAIILWFLTFYPKPPADHVPPFETGIAGSTEVADGSVVVHGPLAYAEMTDPNDRRAVELSYSIAGRTGRFLEPVLLPIGFDWRIGTALIGAVAAKEVFVAQMGIVFAVGEADETSEDLRTQLRSKYSPLVGFCIMLFALVATPCIATFAITRQEARSTTWALAQSWGLTLLAWVLTFAVYQVGILMGLSGLTRGGVG